MLPRDLESFTPPRGWGWTVIAPAGRAVPGASRTAPSFAVSRDRLREAVLKVARAEPRTELLAEEGDHLRFRIRSRLFGFPDLVCIRLVEPAPGQVSLAIFSKARYGFHDLGVNRRRARRWLRAVTAEL